MSKKIQRDTFIFQPSWGMQRSHKPEIKRVSFGDGYEQTAPKGLHHNLRTYSVSFSGTMEYINRILAFLERQGGYKAFYWTPYGSTTPSTFRVNEWQISYQTGYATLSAEFREVVG